MKVLHLLTAGGLGGIEILTHDIGAYSSHDNAFCFMFGTGKTYERMQSEGMKVYDLSGAGKKLSIRRFDELFKVARQYDIIVVHHGDPNLKLFYYVTVKTLKKRGITFIHSCWDDNLFFPNNKFKHKFGKILFQKAMDVSDKIVFVSNAGMNSYIENFKINTLNATVIYNGIGLDKLTAGERYNKNRSQKINITYIGRIESTKGIDMLIQAFRNIQNSNVTLNIVGTGLKLEYYKNFVKTVGLEERVVFHGPQINIIPYLEKADIFVYPSTCQEVFGISIVEAMAFGILCVANSVGGIPEVISNGVNGYLNEQCTAESLKEILTMAINKSQNHEDIHIRANAKKTAKKFTIENTCKELDELIIELSE